MVFFRGAIPFLGIAYVFSRLVRSEHDTYRIISGWKTVWFRVFHSNKMSDMKKVFFQSMIHLILGVLLTFDIYKLDLGMNIEDIVFLLLSLTVAVPWYGFSSHASKISELLK